MCACAICIRDDDGYDYDAVDADDDDGAVNRQSFHRINVIQLNQMNWSPIEMIGKRHAISAKGKFNANISIPSTISVE